MLTGAQIRQARERLGWSTVTLARKCRVDYATLVNAQLSRDKKPLSPLLAAAVRATVESAGVEFIMENEKITGVRLKVSPQGRIEGPAETDTPPEERLDPAS